MEQSCLHEVKHDSHCEQGISFEGIGALEHPVALGDFSILTALVHKVERKTGWCRLNAKKPKGLGNCFHSVFLFSINGKSSFYQVALILIGLPQMLTLGCLPTE